jgi:hypothetical protein
LLLAGLIAVVAVPAAAAKATSRVKLSVLPLPAASLGPEASSLPLELGSGVVSNQSDLADAVHVTPNRLLGGAPVALAKARRVSGYALDYGDGASGGAGVDEVWTSVDEYKSSADAQRVLAFWRRWDRLVTPQSPGNRTSPRPSRTRSTPPDSDANSMATTFVPSARSSSDVGTIASRSCTARAAS